MKEIVQVKLFGGFMRGTPDNEKEANAFLATLDPSQIVSILATAATFNDVPHESGLRVVSLFIN